VFGLGDGLDLLQVAVGNRIPHRCECLDAFLSRAGVVAGLDMTTEGALTKLAYLLALPESTPECLGDGLDLLQVAVGNRIPHRCECLDAFGEGAVRVHEQVS
jgi:hypothetical protein